MGRGGFINKTKMSLRFYKQNFTYLGRGGFINKTKIFTYLGRGGFINKTKTFSLTWGGEVL